MKNKYIKILLSKILVPTSAMNKSNEFKFLDGMRGFAALMVLFFHASEHGLLHMGTVTDVGAGDVGVSLFFVLSAFLLTRILLVDFENIFQSHKLKKYFFRRFMRVYPLYTLYLLIALFTSVIMFNLFEQEKGAPFYLTLNDFFLQMFLQKGIGVTWTIIVEFQYYFILPFLVYMFGFCFKKSIWLGLALFLALFLSSSVIWPSSLMTPQNTFIGNHISIFFLGSFPRVFFL